VWEAKPSTESNLMSQDVRAAAIAAMGFEPKCCPPELKQFRQLPFKINGFGYQMIS